MKKEYFKPTVKTVRMRVHSMLASSPGVVDLDEESQGSGASKEEGDDIGW